KVQKQGQSAEKTVSRRGPGRDPHRLGRQQPPSETTHFERFRARRPAPVRSPRRHAFRDCTIPPDRSTPPASRFGPARSVAAAKDIVVLRLRFAAPPKNATGGREWRAKTGQTNDRSSSAAKLRRRFAPSICRQRSKTHCHYQWSRKERH